MNFLKYPERVSLSWPLVFLLLAGGFVLLTGCDKGKGDETAAGSDKDSTAVADSADQDSTEVVLAVPVEVSGVKMGDVHDYILQNATVDTEEGVDVYSRLVGVVVKLVAEEGDRIRRGGLLCQLEDDDYRLDRDKLKVAYEKRQVDFRRFKDMYEKQLTSAEKYEEARFNLEQARIDYERAELNLTRTRITAPIAGVVTRRHVRLGERVTSSNQLFRIVDMTDKITVVHIPEREIGRLKQGQQAYLSTDNLPGKRFEAAIKRIAPAVDAASGTFKVTVGLKDPGESLRPGMFVSVRIVTETHRNALLVPKSSVVYENGLSYAFFIEQDTLARRVRLEKGFSNENYLEVLASVCDTDRVVVVGQNGLKDGAKIKVVQGLLEESAQDTSQRDEEEEKL
ncbi:MAG: efflux RND transporter periplasmic adaptor subunit [Gemmatimonadota bacterium]|nr:efflux RND transporter periplasmic adaptor subunit [Gemmatimonadota bacterium]